jgi:PAS domain S-box-containing protein
MRKSWILELCAVILLLSMAKPGQSQDVSGLAELAKSVPIEQRQVLVLDSYQYGLPVPDGINRSILNTLTEGGVSLRDIYVEHLELSRMPKGEDRASVVDLLRRKLTGKRFGVVIAEGSFAVEIMAREAKDLFPDAALLTLIAPSINSLRNSPRRVINVPWRVDPAGTLRVALAMFPGTRRVVVVTGANDGILPFLDEAREAFTPWNDKLEFEYTNEMTYEEMMGRISDLPSDSIIIYSSYFTDSSGRSFAPIEVAAKVSQAATAPVFGTLEVFLGHGIVGGSLVRTTVIGKQAGEVSLGYLNGSLKLPEPETTFDTTTQMMFDWHELIRWRVDTTRLPKDSIIINQPESFFFKYKDLVLGTAAVVTSLAFAVVALGATIYRRRTAEEALRESEQRFALAMEATKDGLWDWNLCTGEVYYSPGYLAMLGYTSGEVPADASTWVERIHPGDKDAALKANTDCVENRRDDFEVEFRMQAKNGEWRWILGRGKAADRDQNGRATRIVGTHTDITDRARQTREIKLLNRLYSVLSRVSQAVVRATSPETFLEQACREVVEGGGFLQAWIGYVDVAANAVLPAALWGGIGEYVRGITVYADNRPEGRGPTGTCIRERNPSVHNDFLHDPQTLTWRDRAAPFGIASSAAFPIERAGRVWGALTIYSDEVSRFGDEDVELLNKVAGDIGFALDNLDRESERKRAEEERLRLEDRLQRAEKMEALGTLAGGVAHDLNNVLGIVVGYSELLIDDLDESSSTRSEAIEILKGGQRAAAIVQDLLTLARRGVSNRQVLNLNSIIMECQKSPEFASIFSDRRNVLIKADFEADLLNISGSSVHIAKSFLNLVSNAADAMPNSGSITVRTGNRYLDKPISGYDEIREGDYVVLSISDTGEGIPASDLKRIFEPFYTKKVMGRSGTGLGLAVVWGTMKDHHGYINVESEEGKGTTFTLYFPVTREDLSPEKVSLAASEYMGKGESVLVVDDVKEQRDLATAMLTKLNYRVSSVSSGEEAVEYMKEHSSDLVVLDMIMEPGMDGLDTYREILEVHPRQRAIIVSGFSETERVSKAQALGAGAYVKKPYVLEKLGLAIRKEMERT